MTPQDFPESNTTFNSRQEGVDTIEGWVGEAPGPSPDHPPIQTIITCWKPSPEEIQQIIKTGKIWVWFFTNSLPPHSLTSYSPFEPPIDPENN